MEIEVCARRGAPLFKMRFFIIGVYKFYYGKTNKQFEKKERRITTKQLGDDITNISHILMCGCHGILSNIFLYFTLID